MLKSRYGIILSRSSNIATRVIYRVALMSVCGIILPGFFDFALREHLGSRFV
ncbi:MAG: hypothetical protein K2M41_08130 [Muribaculaceae bacterium]|nr:hypothetical protein [Muribaculaceae bacterium]